MQGAYFSAADPDTVTYQADNLICIDNSGYIAAIVTPQDSDYAAILATAQKRDCLIQLSTQQVVLPGFIDLHIHAPQWPNAGVALDRPLEEWLNVYTFPLEAQYQDANFAQQVYADLVQELLAQGTTTALYFGSVHNQGNLALAQACLKYQQRGFIGKVVMDNPEQTPANYRDESAAQALQATQSFIEQLQQLNQITRISLTPVITPRFLPSCSDEALAGLGQLAHQYNLPIQSHCSESDWENGYALQHYHQRDAQVLNRFGLLTNKAVMAHGTLLNEDDLNLFQQQGVAIAHCPISNVYFGNAILPTKTILQKQIKMGLGTDISGGYSASLYQNIRQAVISAHQRHDGVDGQINALNRGTQDEFLTIKNAFYLATLGGARSLQLPTGQIKVGCYADLQIVHNNWTTWQSETPAMRFEKLMYHTDKNNIDQVLVQGQIIQKKE
ncbi:MAG: guanine deaminase [Lactobacillus sp.]|nr:guanine deaminase [Lactobacillus sp.]